MSWVFGGFRRPPPLPPLGGLCCERFLGKFVFLKYLFIGWWFIGFRNLVFPVSIIEGSGNWKWNWKKQGYKERKVYRVRSNICDDFSF
jgi:hypothetical protein